MYERDTCSVVAHIAISAVDAETIPCIVEIDEPENAKINFMALWFARYRQSENGLSYQSLTKAVSAVALLRDYYVLACNSMPMSAGKWGGLIRDFLYAVDHGTCLGWTISSNEKYHEVRNGILSFIKFCHDVEPLPMNERDLAFLRACVESGTLERELTSSRLYGTFKRSRKKTDEHIASRSLTGKPFPPHLVHELIRHTKNPRDKFLFALLAFGGKRISEYMHLFLEDVLSEDGELKILFRHPSEFKMSWTNHGNQTSKGTRAEYLRSMFGLSPRTQHGRKKSAAGWKGMAYDHETQLEAEAYWIQEAGEILLELFRTYLTEARALAPKKNHPYLFINKNGSPLTIAAVEKQFRLACKRLEKKFGVKLDGYGPHSLRHYYGFYCIDVLKMDLLRLQKFMHHVFASSTAVYAHSSPASARRALKSAYDTKGAKTELDGAVLSDDERLAISAQFANLNYPHVSELLAGRPAFRGVPTQQKGRSHDQPSHHFRQRGGIPYRH